MTTGQGVTSGTWLLVTQEASPCVVELLPPAFFAAALLWLHPLPPWKTSAPPLGRLSCRRTHVKSLKTMVSSWILGHREEWIFL